MLPTSTQAQQFRRIANRGAINERAAQGNLGQFNSLDLLLPWFGTRRSVVQIHCLAKTSYTHKINDLGQSSI
jgi:hypothetical protein